MKFPKGGNGKMFGKSGSGTQAPGTSAKKSGKGGKFPMGGNGKMFGKTGVKPSKKC